MNNFQFINYEKTPNDNLQIGVVTILDVAQQEIKRYRHMQKKDGSSTYFATGSICITDSLGQKKYYDCMEQDSRSKQEMLMAFIRKNVATALEESRPSTPASVFNTVATSEKDEGVPF